MEKDYKICTRCIMDNVISPKIKFDENSVCNYCKEYFERVKKEIDYSESGQKKFNRLINKIKEDGRNKEYDCIIGVSGGVDSTFVAYTVKKLGLRPLAVHLDNGWNSELSVRNIEKMCKALDIELYTYVIDWEEFKDLQLSFLKASISNAEIPTDHAIMALLFHVASERGVKYIIPGHNLVTEGIMSHDWGYDARDWKIIKSIHEKFGRIKLKTFPHLTLKDIFYYVFIKRIKWFTILDYINYNKKEAIQILERELDWKPYGAKHYESIFTRFFQGYILPKKFNVDKRRGHLSTLICSGQMTREEALEEMKKDPYPTKEMMKEDKEYVIKKFGITEEEFDKIMSLPIKTYKDYPNNSFVFNDIKLFAKIIKKVAKV